MKNKMRTPKKKEIIVKKYLNGKTIIKLANKHNVERKLIYSWARKYQEKRLNDLIYNIRKSKGNIKGVNIRKPKNRTEEHELDIMKKDIEIAQKKRLHSERR